MVKINLNGQELKHPSGVTIEELARAQGTGICKSTCAGRISGKIVDIRTAIDSDCQLELLTFADDDGKMAYWHTTAHIMAQAVKRLFNGAMLAIGPAIDKGFYYDFDLDRPLVPKDLIAIESEIKKIIKENLPIERFFLSESEASTLMQQDGQKYKLELIRDLAAKGNPLSFYRQGEFVDLCAGPHLASTGMVKAVKLLSCTGAYWRGDASGATLQRIYGISFPKSDELTQYLQMIEEAKKRDHRKIGRELELFDIMEEGPGFPFFLPNGMILRNTLENFWRAEHSKAGYVEIKSPIMLNQDLWLRSGHWEHYKDNMYITQIDDQDFAIKPMNCPGGMLVYKSKLHSYRDFPLRMAELGLVHRHELSGALHGLMRVRCFTQDDAHVFMTEDQIELEIRSVIDLIERFYSIFGFSYHIELSTRPENSMGSDAQWDKATAALKNVLTACSKEYKINEGDGAFYGPKIDFHLNDCLGRTWQCGTIQVDFQMPERFDLSFIGEDGEKHRPVMIHRVIFGSIERFIAILTEHFAGAFPLWLAPEQVRVLPISEKSRATALEVFQKLTDEGLRATFDERNEKIGYKIREAQLKKIPYMLVIGEKEAADSTVSVRARGNSDLNSMQLDDFTTMVALGIASKSIN